MKFTFEVEQNDKLCFLDIDISRDGNKFKTSLYRKPHLVVFTLISIVLYL